MGVIDGNGGGMRVPWPAVLAKGMAKLGIKGSVC